MKENPTLKIQISGHTDNMGKATDNLTLSNNRAQAVVKYLVSKGIEPARLTFKGYGATKPVADNATEEGKARNPENGGAGYKSIGNNNLAISNGQLLCKRFTKAKQTGKQLTMRYTKPWFGLIPGHGFLFTRHFFNHEIFILPIVGLSNVSAGWQRKYIAVYDCISLVCHSGTNQQILMTIAMTNDLLYQLALTQVPHIGCVHAKQLIQQFHSAEAIFKARAAELEKIEGIGTVRARCIKTFKEFTQAEKEISFIEKYRIKPLFLNHPEYPQRLLNCYDSPTLLFYRGQANLNTARIIAVIGTRSILHVWQTCYRKADKRSCRLRRSCSKRPCFWHRCHCP